MTDLHAHEIGVRFGGVNALDGVTVAVGDGEFVGLIGPNGAGKTTLFDVVSGFAQPSAGRVVLGGIDVTRLPASKRANLGLGRTFQRLELFGRMTVFDNLLVAAETAPHQRGVAQSLRGRRGRNTAGVAEEMLVRLGLEWARDRRPEELPFGTSRLLELARALCAAPSILLLDEPSAGLDDAEKASLIALLRSVHDEMGIGILLVEHDVDLVLRTCSRVYVLDSGSVIAHGAPRDVAEDSAVRAAYLGEDGDGLAASRA